MKPSALPILLALSFCMACGSNAEDGAEVNSNPVDSTASQIGAPGRTLPQADDGTRYTWVDDLNLRAQPNTTAPILSKLPLGEQVVLTGSRTEDRKAVVLRGGLYVEPWYEVRRDDGTTGWLFGGALKTKGEDKGTAAYSAAEVAFEHFGRFDLSGWRASGPVPVGNGEGDFDTQQWTYTQGDKRLVVETLEGEYGYGTKHHLYGLQDELLKTRNFYFDNLSHELTERVTDHTQTPAVSQVRTQTSPLSYQQLNAKPVRVHGTWRKDDAATAHSPSSIQLLGALNEVRCALGGPSASTANCECSFRRLSTPAEEVFRTKLGASACIRIGDEPQELTGYTDIYAQLDGERPWIVLTDAEVLLFGNPVNVGDTEAVVERLAAAMLSLNPVPREVRIDNRKTGGMAVREIRDLVSEASQAATRQRAQGVVGAAARFHYRNDDYDLLLSPTLQASGRLDEGSSYTGTLELRTADGDLLEVVGVTGGCGC